MRRLLIGLVKAYRLLLSAHMGNQCRYTPTCSAYAIEALERHGSVAGSYLALRRIGRCHPWCAGGHDPVPSQPLFSGFTRHGRDADPVTKSSRSNHSAP